MLSGVSYMTKAEMKNYVSPGHIPQGCKLRDQLRVQIRVSGFQPMDAFVSVIDLRCAKTMKARKSWHNILHLCENQSDSNKDVTKHGHCS